jgi:hypothetical protein
VWWRRKAHLTEARQNIRLVDEAASTGDSDMRGSASQSPFRAVAHELLNPLASLRGGIETIAGDHARSDDVRARLLDVVVRQSERLEWLIRAAVADPSAGPAHITFFDARHVVGEAVALTGARAPRDPGSVRIRAEERSFRLAVEAVLMAMTHGGATAHVDVTPARLRVTSTYMDVRDASFLWKAELARRLLRRSDLRLRVRATGDAGSVATISLRAPRTLRSVS